MLSIHVHAQYHEDSISINIGDAAPPLYVQEWIKGSPIQQLEKGRIYVLEFWATWCRPCMAAMPHISALARKYHDKITFIGMDVYEQENNQYPFPEIVDLSGAYNQIAEWYWRADNKPEAIVAQQKTIEALKKKKNLPASYLAAFESRLRQYMEME